MGEHPSRVFNVGAIGIDSIKKLKLLSKKQIEDYIGVKFNKKSVVVTFHPVTLENFTAEQQFRDLLLALDEISDCTLIFTKANSDKGGRIINQMIDDFVNKNKHKAVGFASLGQLRYLSTLQHVDFVIGNSSSGVLEVPYFKIPTINIGDRQKGRLMPERVINCTPTYNEISKAIEMAQDNEFLSRITTQENIYGDGEATSKIMNTLRKIDFSVVQKQFYDLKNSTIERI